MEVRPHRTVKLDGDPEAVAGFLARRLGFKRSTASPVGHAVAWAGFVVGPTLVILAAVLFVGRTAAIIGAIVLALAIVGLSLLFVTALRRAQWFRGYGVRFLIEKVEGEEGEPHLLRVREEREPGLVAEIELPPEPPKPEAEATEHDDEKRLRPELYLRLVPFLATCFTSLTARSVSDTVAPRRVSELRGFALLGETARTLQTFGARGFRRGGTGSGFERLAGLMGLILPVIVALTELGALILIATFALAVLAPVFHHFRSRPLHVEVGDGEPLRLIDRLDGETYTVVLTGPGGEHAVEIDARRILAGGFAILDEKPFLPALDGPMQRARNETESHSGLNSPPPAG